MHHMILIFDPLGLAVICAMLALGFGLGRLSKRIGRLAVNRRERLTIVAALDNWAASYDQAESENWPAFEKASHAGRIEPLDEHEIEGLSQRLDWER